MIEESDRSQKTHLNKIPERLNNVKDTSAFNKNYKDLISILE